MNKDNAKDYLPLVKALSEGKKIRQKFNGQWIDGESWEFNQPPEHYLIFEPEPEKFVACEGWYVGRKGVSVSCGLPKGHSGPCGGITPAEPPTCIHCGKDPFVKDEMDRDYDAYCEFLKLNGWMEQERTKLAWCAGMNYARKGEK